MNSQPLLPNPVQIRRADSDPFSVSSYSSKSSIQSYNDAGSGSSLDMSFDNAGNPIFKQLPKPSAFAKVKGDSEVNNSVSEDEDSLNSKSDEGNQMRNVAMNPQKPRQKKKSSFYFKNLEGNGQ